jgi:hypothetical protein
MSTADSASYANRHGPGCRFEISPGTVVGLLAEWSKERANTEERAVLEPSDPIRSRERCRPHGGRTAL